MGLAQPLPDSATLQELASLNLLPAPTLNLEPVARDGKLFALLEICIRVDGPAVRFVVRNVFRGVEWHSNRPTRQGSHNIPYAKVTDALWQKVEGQFTSQQRLKSPGALRRMAARCAAEFREIAAPPTFLLLDDVASVNQEPVVLLGSLPWSVVVDFSTPAQPCLPVRRDRVSARALQRNGVWWTGPRAGFQARMTRS